MLFVLRYHLSEGSQTFYYNLYQDIEDKPRGMQGLWQLHYFLSLYKWLSFNN